MRPEQVGARSRDDLLLGVDRLRGGPTAVGARDKHLNTSYFGAGDPAAPGAANDAVYTWLHQDIGLFLLPALVLVMLAVERLVAPRLRDAIGWATIVGTSVTFLGGMVFVFVNPALHGPGYDISTVGLLIVGLALLATLWYGALRHATTAFPAVGTRLGPAAGHSR